MSEKTIVEHCSPTLAGIKTGNIFSVSCASRQEIMEDVRSINRRLRPRGLEMLILRFSSGRALLYLFRPDRLQADLSGREARSLLSSFGYSGCTASHCLPELSRRLRGGTDFPHEIGLFLSYPPEDVRGFIENHAENYKCAGFWKVYGDAEASLHTFDRFRKCTLTYRRSYAAGRSLEELAVRT